MDKTKPPGIRIAQIFLDSARLRHRDDYLSIPPDRKPDVGDVELQFQVSESEGGETALVRIRASTKPESEPIYEFEVTMTAIVEVNKEKPNMPLDRYTTRNGIALVLPFVRQAVADLTMRGRFGPVWLNPMNVTATVSRGPDPVRKKEAARGRTRRAKASKKKTTSRKAR